MLLLSRFIISGHSMEPTILQGQTVLASGVSYLFSKPKVGDIVAFIPYHNGAGFKEKKTGKIFMKRIVKIDKNKYFVKGDNVKDSLDSRKLGSIKIQDIIGKVIL